MQILQNLSNCSLQRTKTFYKRISQYINILIIAFSYSYNALFGTKNYTKVNFYEKYLEVACVRRKVIGFLLVGVDGFEPPTLCL